MQEKIFGLNVKPLTANPNNDLYKDNINDINARNK